MIKYGEPPSNQLRLELAGTSDAGMELIKEARLWAGRNYKAWLCYKNIARKQCAQGKEASPNYCLQVMRNEMKISVKNSYAPAFARIAMEEDPSLKFRVAKSKVDGFTTVKL